jgi:outer membrane protein assembly factor BamB
LVVPGRDSKKDLVFCLDPQNGKVIWVGSYKAKANSNHGPGARATPFIDEEHVYTFGRSGDLVCWKLEDGQLIWRQNVEDEGGKEPTWGHSCSPLVYQDKIIVQGGGKALVIAYDKMTGNVIWKSMEGKAGYAAITLMEAAGAEKLLIFYGTGLMCLQPNDGSNIWSFLWQTSYDVNATTPVTSGSIIFITSGYNTGCQALKIEDEGVNPLWRSKVIASHHSDPAIINGYIYGYSGQSNQNKGLFKCVDLESGEEKWSTGEIGWGTAVYVDGHLLCMDIKGNLFLVKPDPNGFNKVAELRDALGDVSHPAWTIPVIANGRLYLRYMQRLLCYDLVPQ